MKGDFSVDNFITSASERYNEIVLKCNSTKSSGNGMQLMSVFIIVCHECKKDNKWDFEYLYWKLLKLLLGSQHNTCENSVTHSLHADVQISKIF